MAETDWDDQETIVVSISELVEAMAETLREDIDQINEELRALAEAGLTEANQRRAEELHGDLETSLHVVNEMERVAALGDQEAFEWLGRNVTPEELTQLSQRATDASTFIMAMAASNAEEVIETAGEIGHTAGAAIGLGALLANAGVIGAIAPPLLVVGGVVGLAGTITRIIIGRRRRARQAKKNEPDQ